MLLPYKSDVYTVQMPYKRPTEQNRCRKGDQQNRGDDTEWISKRVVSRQQHAETAIVRYLKR